MGVWHTSRKPRRIQGDGTVNRPGPRDMYRRGFPLSEVGEKMTKESFDPIEILFPA